jgi:hypothetical protein
MAKNEKDLKEGKYAPMIRSSIAAAMKTAKDKDDFTQKLLERGVGAVFRLRTTAGIMKKKFSKAIIAYNTLLSNLDKYKVKPQFFVINFDNLRQSHRCNPINPHFMSDISDAYESAYTIMLNLNRTWIQKQGDFFVESPIILLASIIWYLTIYKNGKYCTFPHAIEFLNKPYADIFTILTSYPELENYLSPFMDAWKSNAQYQLQGQIASAKIPLSRMISPQLYWVMSGDDFTLDINNPNEPKILCVGNNPDRQNIYSAALGLYNSRIVKLINKKGMLKSSETSFPVKPSAKPPRHFRNVSERYCKSGSR